MRCTNIKNCQTSGVVRLTWIIKLATYCNWLVYNNLTRQVSHTTMPLKMIRATLFCVCRQINTNLATITAMYKLNKLSNLRGCKANLTRQAIYTIPFLTINLLSLMSNIKIKNLKVGYLTDMQIPAFVTGWTHK